MGAWQGYLCSFANSKTVDMSQSCVMYGTELNENQTLNCTEYVRQTDDRLGMLRVRLGSHMIADSKGANSKFPDCI